eukprot:5275532-Amphidinium_carterae.1
MESFIKSCGLEIHGVLSKSHERDSEDVVGVLGSPCRQIPMQSRRRQANCRHCSHMVLGFRERR